MLKVLSFTFNPFMENTYLVYDETLDCAIIDPGCITHEEREQLRQAIADKGLNPVKLWNTHCHIDHFPGNKFICDTYHLLPEFHRLEYDVMKAALSYRQVFGLDVEESPKPNVFLEEKDVVSVGHQSFTVLFVPGHSPGHIAFYNEKEQVIFSGDVLFSGSIGRYDLPGANGALLFQTLHEKMMALPDGVRVYCGHGPSTTIGQERATNPFLQGDSEE